MFHLEMKHFVECLLLLLKQKHLEGEIKDARMSSLSSDHQHSLNINFYELLMSLRSISQERQFTSLCTKILWNFGQLVW